MYHFWGAGGRGVQGRDFFGTTVVRLDYGFIIYMMEWVMTYKDAGSGGYWLVGGSGGSGVGGTMKSLSL